MNSSGGGGRRGSPSTLSTDQQRVFTPVQSVPTPPTTVNVCCAVRPPDTTWMVAVPVIAPAGIVIGLVITPLAGKTLLPSGKVLAPWIKVSVNAWLAGPVIVNVAALPGAPVVGFTVKVRPACATGWPCAWRAGGNQMLSGTTSTRDRVHNKLRHDIATSGIRQLGTPPPTACPWRLRASSGTGRPTGRWRAQGPLDQTQNARKRYTYRATHDGKGPTGQVGRGVPLRAPVARQASGAFLYTMLTTRSNIEYRCRLHCESGGILTTEGNLVQRAPRMKHRRRCSDW